MCLYINDLRDIVYGFREYTPDVKTTFLVCLMNASVVLNSIRVWSSLFHLIKQNIPESGFRRTGIPLPVDEKAIPSCDVVGRRDSINFLRTIININWPQSESHRADAAGASEERVAENTGRRTQYPGGDADDGEDRRGSPDARTIAGEEMGGGGTRVVEEYASVGPFLEPGETGDENCNGTGNLPEAENEEHVVRITEMVHDGADVLDAAEIPGAAHGHFRGDDHGREPVGDEAEAGGCGSGHGVSYASCVLRSSKLMGPAPN